LVGQNPDVLWSEEEQGGCDGALAHTVLAGGTELAEVVDEAEVHGAPVRAICRGVDELLAVVGSSGEVLERHPSVFGLGKCASGRPAVGRGEVALCCRRGCYSENRSDCRELHDQEAMKIVRLPL